MTFTTATASLAPRDGRRLDVRISGPAEGVPLLFHHGTPEAVAALHHLERLVHARGLRLITTSQPGYGTSTRQLGRCVVDGVVHSAEVLAWAGADRGFSAG